MVARFEEGAPLKEGISFEGEELKGLKIWVRPTEYQKCERCWQRRPEVGTLENPELCKRCLEVIRGN